MSASITSALQLKLRTRAKALGIQSGIKFLTVKYMKRSIPLLLIVRLILYVRQFLQIGVAINGIEEIHPLNYSAKTKWAVMMVGAPRSYMITRTSFMQNVVNQSYPPMDVFTFAPRIANPSCRADLESLRLLETDSTVIHFDENYLVLEGRDISNVTLDRLVRQQNETFQMIDNYATQQNINYEFIFYTRPDLYHTLPVNITALEEKLTNVTDAVFNPGCCTYGGWCDQLTVGKYQDFAKMIGVSRHWASVDPNIEHGHPETLFMTRGHFANLSSFDLNHNEDYRFSILRLQAAKDACIEGRTYTTYGVDGICGSYVLNSTLEQCELLNMSDICSVGTFAAG